MSGDSNKVNPELALNLQAKVVKYNPKLEIDRANFTIGKILGAGHFGCAFEGFVLFR